MFVQKQLNDILNNKKHEGRINPATNLHPRSEAQNTALRTCSSGVFGIHLISDIGMPDEDGYSLIRKLRQLEVQRGGRMPAVALTAYARSDDRTKALLAGFQMHLTKPVDAAELATVIACLTERTGRF